MSRRKDNLYRIQYSPWFQVSYRDLGMYPSDKRTITQPEQKQDKQGRPPGDETWVKIWRDERLAEVCEIPGQDGAKLRAQDGLSLVLVSLGCSVQG